MKRESGESMRNPGFSQDSLHVEVAVSCCGGASAVVVIFGSVLRVATHRQHRVFFQVTCPFHR